MRTRLRALACIASVSAVLATNAVQVPKLRLRLMIDHDGRSVTAPDHMTMTVEGKHLRVPIINGNINVPAIAARAKVVDLCLEIGGEEIRIPALDSGKFEFSDWTLLLADKTYGEGYQNEVLPGVDIRRTCMLRFDGPKFEGVITIVDDCRRKVKE